MNVMNGILVWDDDDDDDEASWWSNLHILMQF